MLAGLEQFKNALPLLKQLVEDSNSTDPCLKRDYAVVLVRTGNYTEAVKILMPLTESSPELNDAYLTLIDYEQRAHEALVAALQADGIMVVDALPALGAAVARGEGVYRNAADGHPTTAGYRVIAEVVHEALVVE